MTPARGQTKNRTNKAKITNSIVDEEYRQTYKDRGNPSHCGDWVALALEELTHNAKGEFDMGTFITILEMNGVLSHAKYIRDNQGARGRFRMTCGAMLRAKVRQTGVLRTPKGDVTPPPSRKRH